MKAGVDEVFEPWCGTRRTSLRNAPAHIEDPALRHRGAALDAGEVRIGVPGKRRGIERALGEGRRGRVVVGEHRRRGERRKRGGADPGKDTAALH